MIDGIANFKLLIYFWIFFKYSDPIDHSLIRVGNPTINGMTWYWTYIYWKMVPYNNVWLWKICIWKIMIWNFIWEIKNNLLISQLMQIIIGLKLTCEIYYYYFRRWHHSDHHDDDGYDFDCCIVLLK